MLIWNFLAVFVLWYLSDSWFRSYSQHWHKSSGTIISMALFGFTLPLAGWLADACVGRYRMIYCSVLIMWIATILETLSRVIESLVGGSYAPVDSVITRALLGLMGIGVGSFLSTVVQFGIDQLQDASTEEISAYIMWYLWTYSCPILLINLTSNYFQSESDQHLILLNSLILCINLTLILVMLFCCNNWLIKEPIVQNPFKLIYRVSRYAIKNKYPQYRSAFTYCEDEPISRIDFGKRKYGGPFTTEQVEDVKTFYKSLPIIILSGVAMGEQVAGKFLNISIKHQFVVPSKRLGMMRFTNSSLSTFIPYSMSVLIVLHEVLFYPIFQRCCTSITSLRKFIVGAVLQIGTILALMIFELLSRQSYLKENGYNETVLCVFYKDQTLATKFNYNWIAVPDTLFVISTLLMTVGGLEFIAAQVPYSMKGVLLGVCYCSIVISGTVNDISLNIGPFQQKLSIWGTGVISCGFWYALLHIILCTAGYIVSVLIIKWYKRRKREDVLPYEHIYAENKLLKDQCADNEALVEQEENERRRATYPMSTSVCKEHIKLLGNSS